MKELTVTWQGEGGPWTVGTLADDGRQVLFQYDPQALARGLELSPIRLPLRPRAWPDHPADWSRLHDVPGLVYDSLPDGWGYLLMHRRMKARGMNPWQASTLDHLAFLGENTMGALTYAPARSEALGRDDLSLLDLARETQAVLRDDSHQVLAELLRVAGSPGGARPKALVYLNPETGEMSTREGLVPGAQAWLVKFPGSGDAPDVCALEALYARMADLCELGMTATRFFPLQNGLSAFGTRRFDRQDGQRVHVHTLAGLLHADFRSPGLGYEDWFRVCRRLTRDQRELRKAVQRCVFNILLNNRDDHAKNVSFRFTPSGGWQLAPPYDLTWSVGYRGEHFMDVAGEGREPGRRHVILAAQAAGLPQAVVENAIDEILDCVTPQKLEEQARNLPVQAGTVDMVCRAMNTNAARLAGKV